LLTPQAGGDTNRYLFSTKELDSRSGLQFFGARYYDPEVGRWITPDPLGFVNGPDVYLYCLNNPINSVDPNGLDIIMPGLPLPMPILPEPGQLGGSLGGLPPISGHFGGSNTSGGTSSDGNDCGGKENAQGCGATSNLVDGTAFSTDGSASSGGDQTKPPQPPTKYRNDTGEHFDKNTQQDELEHWHYQEYNWSPTKKQWFRGPWKYGGPGKAPGTNN